MAEFPPAWYGLWVVVAICGVLTWYLRHFTQRVNATKMSALLGSAAMLTLLFWTLLDF